MKKFTLILTGLLLTAFISSAQIRVGVTGAVQYTNLLVDDNGTDGTAGRITGFAAGVLADAPLSNKVSIRPQLLYSLKGSEDAANISGVSATTRLTFNYLELPIQIIYKINAGPGQVALGAGPYVAYALSANAKVSAQGQSASSKIDLGSGIDQLKALDYGARFSIGYELPVGLLFSAYASSGFSNLSNVSGENIKTGALGLSVGYLFGHK